MGADPVAFVTAGVAATRGRLLKAFSVRKEAKDHGGGGRIAGALDPGDRVVITEDTVTRGTSLLEAAHAVHRGRCACRCCWWPSSTGAGRWRPWPPPRACRSGPCSTAPDLGFDYEGG